MDDEDCDTTCVHWMQTGISESVTNFEEGDAATDNTLHLPTTTNKYVGPFPPVGSSHSYTIEIFALNKESSDMTDLMSRQEFKDSVGGHILATASLTGIFTTSLPMSLTSATFIDGGKIPDSMAATSSDGVTITSNNISPQLSWQNVPAGTMSLTIIMDDQTAPECSTTTCVHWTQVDISTSTTSLSAGDVSGPSHSIRWTPPSVTNEYVGPFPTINS